MIQLFWSYGSFIWLIGFSYVVLRLTVGSQEIAVCGSMTTTAVLVLSQWLKLHKTGGFVPEWRVTGVSNVPPSRLENISSSGMAERDLAYQIPHVVVFRLIWMLVLWRFRNKLSLKTRRRGFVLVLGGITNFRLISSSRLAFPWLANETRLDIANVVRAEVRYATEPREVHWSTAIGIFEHFFGTDDFGITFLRRGGIELVAFADADYVSNATDRRSGFGGAAMCAGACVCWFSRTQKCVTLSTTEAEYVALGDTIKETMFIRYLWSLSLRVLVWRVWRYLRIARGQDTCPKPSVYVELQAHRRATSFSEGMYFRGGVDHYLCRVEGSACRLPYKDAQ